MRSTPWYEILGQARKPSAPSPVIETTACPFHTCATWDVSAATQKAGTTHSSPPRMAMGFNGHHRLDALHRIQELSEDCSAVALEQGHGCQSCCAFLLLLNAFYLCVIVSWYYHDRVLQIWCLITVRTSSLMFLEASSLISGCPRGTGFHGSWKAQCSLL